MSNGPFVPAQRRERREERTGNHKPPENRFLRQGDEPKWSPKPTAATRPEGAQTPNARVLTSPQESPQVTGNPARAAATLPQRPQPPQRAGLGGRPGSGHCSAVRTRVPGARRHRHNEPPGSEGAPALGALHPPRATYF